jgi:hypothetical protein
MDKQFNRVDQGVDLQNLNNKGQNPVYCGCDGKLHMAKEENGVGFGPNYAVVIRQPTRPRQRTEADGIYYGHILTGRRASRRSRMHAGN